MEAFVWRSQEASREIECEKFDLGLFNLSEIQTLQAVHVRRLNSLPTM